MTRQEYIDSRYAQYLYRWTNISIIAGALVSLALTPLDMAVSPENSLRFTFYKLAMGAGFVALLALKRRYRDSERIQVAAAFAAAALASATLATMVYGFGGHASVYFAGFILLLIFVVGVIPFRPRLALLAALVVYMSYLLPILAYDTISDPAFFAAANVLIIACAVSLLIMRYFSHQGLMNEYSLGHHVRQQKEKLESRSAELEELVGDRTRELDASESSLRSLFDGASVGIIISSGGVVTDVNRRLCEMLGYGRDELIGSRAAGIEIEGADPNLEERLELLEHGETASFEATLFRSDGSSLPVEVASCVVDAGGVPQAQSFIQDVTEKRRLQAQLNQSQKMEAVGRLAGGVAHDFNNMLTTILANCELALMDLPGDHPVRPRLGEIQDSARRAAEVTAQLLSFSRRQVMKMEVVDLNGVIAGIGGMLERLIGVDIDLRLELQEPLRPVVGDRSRLEQVIMNLVVNARDAMPFGGRLLVRTGDADIDAEAAARYEGMAAGSYVLLAVTDDGKGMSQEMIDKIFEPFFTTKEAGKGTGLGLATVLGIVKQHKGYVYAESAAGKGTTFRVFLPAAMFPGPRPGAGLPDVEAAAGPDAEPPASGAAPRP